MAVDILFYNETDEDVEVYEAVIRDIVAEAVRFEGFDGHYLCNYVFVDNVRICELNRQYRGKDSVTDVLTFGADDDQLFGRCKHLGDVFISVDRMIEQAYEYGHGEVREMSFLALHGFLHLLGYDHLDAEGERVMFARQEAILDAKDIGREGA